MHVAVKQRSENPIILGTAVKLSLTVKYLCLLLLALLCIIQDVSRLEDITAGGDFLGLCDQKISYKHVSDFGRLRSYGHF
jgi:hypothetical protein